MLRFCGTNFVDKDERFKIVVSGQIRMSDERIWQSGKECFWHGMNRDLSILQMFSVLDAQAGLLCYGWQDVEANRELRMLKELEETPNAISFQTVFPNVKEVVVCGCNELAYYFVKYLEHCNIPVSVTGRYWEYLGYQGIGEIYDDIGRMVITAEPVSDGETDLFQKVIRSVSPYFECIDWIYEVNVLAGRIKDTEEGLGWVLEQLIGKSVVILGTDERAQDAYDLLYQHGIDIWCFLEEKTDGRMRYIPKNLLGKQVCTVWEVMNSGKDVIFISVHGEKSALGTDDVDFFDYYGYRRNRQFFLLNDYTDIAYSNLVHVLNGKKILLTGDEILCGILTEYLEIVEEGNVSVKYIELSQWNVSNDNEQILFVVHPWHGVVDGEHTPELWKFRKQLRQITDISYSEYFSRTGAYVLMDACMNRNQEKYTYGQMIPKEIVLGNIPWASGNILMRGLLDGHPDILQIIYDGEYYEFSNNLFWYCICMARKQNTEAGMAEESSTFLPGFKSFAKTIEEAQILNGKRTSQDVFLAFHIAYMNRMNYVSTVDMSQMVIYWEPHNCPRTETPFLAQWLESEKVGGHVLTMRRNNLVWYGSLYKENDENRKYRAIRIMSGVDVRAWCLSRHWKELIMRFEDIKLHPKTELLKLCKELGIPWSDTLMHTTRHGDEWLFYDGDTVDFDPKPVFNPYEEFLSEFDRFRLSIVSAPYQKRYGYVYENCLKFSRKELQEMFLKEFRFQESLQFETDTDRIVYYLYMYDFIKNALWEARKHAVLDDVIPEFDAVEIGRTMEEEQKRKEQKKNSRRQKALEDLTEFVRKQDRLVFYGIGRDCAGLFEHLDEVDRRKILFCDQKASEEECTFQGKRVITPQNFRDNYRDYKILVTSSRFYNEIQRELESMGIKRDQIVCNTVQLWK